MSRENRPFSPQQDEIIMNMYLKEGIKKWGMIAATLTEQYNLPRNAKQCRDRYKQFLDPEANPDWTLEEQRHMYQLHEEIGNKWAIIANQFPGKNDNCVKNHFYSQLRKSLRHLNKSIKKNFKKQFKQLKIGALYKIIEALEDRFAPNSVLDEAQARNAIRLKRELLAYAEEDESAGDRNLEREKKMIENILHFSRSYKRKSKKQRRSSLNGPDLFKSSSRLSFKCSSEHSSSESEYELILNISQEMHESDHEMNEEKPLAAIEEDIRDSYNSKYSQKVRQALIQPILRYQSEMIDQGELRGSQKSGTNSVEDILRGKGALQFQQLVFNKPRLSHRSVSQHSNPDKLDMFEADDIRLSGGGLIKMHDDIQESSIDHNLFRSHH